MRIGTGLVVIADLIIRCGDLTAHYTDDGIWSCRLMELFNSKPGSWSLHAMQGTYGWALFLFVLHFIAAFFFLIGYHTRLANLMVWLLTVSLHNRNIFILQGGDDLLRLLLFWGLFLPWNRHYSADAKNKNAVVTTKYSGGIAYLFLVASLYFFNANLKSGNEWHSEGTAIYYALSLDQMRLSPFGDWLYHFPGAMKLLTWFVYYTELLAPVLILWPSKKGGLRFAAFILLFLLHSGIALTLYVGLFVAINFVVITGLLPAGFMDRLEKILSLKGAVIQNRIKPLKYRRAIVNFTVLALIIFHLLINLGSVNWFVYELKQEFKYPVNFFRFDQYWGMFSPTVMKKDGWYVYYGTDSLGRQWDLKADKNFVDFSKPRHVVRMYKTDRWRKLAENMQSDYYSFLRAPYCKYIFNKWNSGHPEKKVQLLNLYFMEEESLPDYHTGELKKTLFCICDGR